MRRKHCCSCGKRLSVSKFYRNKYNGDGYQSKCKECQRLYYHSHKEQRKEYQRRYQAGVRRTGEHRYKASSAVYKRPSFKKGEFSAKSIQRMTPEKMIEAINIKLAI